MRIRELFRQVATGRPPGSGSGIELDRDRDRDRDDPGPPPGRPEREEIERMLSACIHAFDENRDRFVPVVRRLLEPGLDVPGALTADLRDCLGRLVELRDRVFRLDLTKVGDGPERTAEPPTSLPEPPVPPEVPTSTGSRPEVAWETRRRALGVLDWVLGLATNGLADVPEISEVLARAGSLRVAIASAPMTDLPPEAVPLASGDHPLAMLLRLSALHDTMSDDAWDELRAAVTTQFGKGVSGAAARGKIVFTEPSGGVGRTD